MKKLLLLFLTLFSFIILKATDTGDIKTDTILPQYVTGNIGLSKYLSRNLRKIKPIREKRIENVKVEIKVIFIVEKDGRVTFEYIINKNVLTLKSQKRIIKVFERMPLWTPGEIRGIPKKVRMIQPLIIK